MWGDVGLRSWRTSRAVHPLKLPEVPGAKHGIVLVGGGDVLTVGGISVFQVFL